MMLVRFDWAWQCLCCCLKSIIKSGTLLYSADTVAGIVASAGQAWGSQSGSKGSLSLPRGTLLQTCSCSWCLSPWLTLNYMMIKTKMSMFVYIRIRQECRPLNPVIPFLGIILRTQLEIHTQIYVQEYHHGIVCNCSNWKWSKLPTVRILAQYIVGFYNYGIVFCHEKSYSQRLCAVDMGNCLKCIVKRKL